MFLYTLDSGFPVTCKEKGKIVFDHCFFPTFILKKRDLLKSHAYKSHAYSLS